MHRYCIIAAIALLGATSPVLAQSCGQLYYQRNAIYKNAGYCFRTGRAIATFGNGGCQYDDVNDVPLSRRERQIVGDIKARERMLGCE